VAGGHGFFGPRMNTDFHGCWDVLYGVGFRLSSDKAAVRWLRRSGWGLWSSVCLTRSREAAKAEGVKGCLGDGVEGR